MQHLPLPNFSSVPVGSLSHYSPEELLENLSTALPKVVTKVPYDGWKNIQNIEIKTGKSASLPVWNCDLDSRWVGVPDAEMIESPEISEADSESEAEEVVPAKASMTAAAKTKEASKKTKSSTQVENKGVAKAGKVAATSAAQVSSDKKEREKKVKTAAKAKK